MTKLEELKAAYVAALDAAYDARDAYAAAYVADAVGVDAADDARDAYAAARTAYAVGVDTADAAVRAAAWEAAWDAYQSELEKTKETL